jgi:hypothetical protein
MNAGSVRARKVVPTALIRLFYVLVPDDAGGGAPTGQRPPRHPAVDADVPA